MDRNDPFGSFVLEDEDRMDSSDPFGSQSPDGSDAIEELSVDSVTGGLPQGLPGADIEPSSAAAPTVSCEECKCTEPHTLSSEDAMNILTNDKNGPIPSAPTRDEVQQACKGVLCAGSRKQRSAVRLWRCKCPEKGEKTKLLYICEMKGHSKMSKKGQPESSVRNHIRKTIKKFLGYGLGEGPQSTASLAPQAEGPAQEPAQGGSPVGSQVQGGGASSGGVLPSPGSGQNLHQCAGAAGCSAQQEMRHGNGHAASHGGEQGGGQVCSYLVAGNNYKEINDLKRSLPGPFPWEAILLYYSYGKEKDSWSQWHRTNGTFDQFRLADAGIEECYEQLTQMSDEQLQEMHRPGSSVRYLRNELVKCTLKAVRQDILNDDLPESTFPDQRVRSLFKHVIDRCDQEPLEKPDCDKLFSEVNDDDETFYTKLRVCFGRSVKLHVKPHSAGSSNSWFLFLQMPSSIARMLLDTVRSVTAVQDRLLDMGYRRIVDSQIELDGSPGQALVCCYNIGECPEWAAAGIAFSGASIEQQHRDVVHQLSCEYRGLHLHLHEEALGRDSSLGDGRGLAGGPVQPKHERGETSPRSKRKETAFPSTRQVDDRAPDIGRNPKRLREAAGEDEGKASITHWVGCDSCWKWRRLSEGSTTQYQNEAFYCSFLPGVTCSTPEEPYEDEAFYCSFLPGVTCSTPEEPYEDEERRQKTDESTRTHVGKEVRGEVGTKEARVRPGTGGGSAALFAGAANPFAEQGAGRAGQEAPAAALVPGVSSEWEALLLRRKLRACWHQLATAPAAKQVDVLRDCLGPVTFQMITQHSSEPKSKGGILKGRGGATRSVHSVPGPRGGERKVLRARGADGARAVQFDSIQDADMGSREIQLSESSLRDATGQSRKHNITIIKDEYALYSSSDTWSDYTDAACGNEEGIRSVREALEDLHDFTDESGACTSEWVLQVTVREHVDKDDEEGERIDSARVQSSHGQRLYRPVVADLLLRVTLKNLSETQSLAFVPVYVADDGSEEAENQIDLKSGEEGELQYPLQKSVGEGEDGWDIKDPTTGATVLKLRFAL